MLLAGDVGGTKTHLAIISPDVGPRNPLEEAIFQSAGHESLEAVAALFLSQVDLPVEQACFGVAGPVLSGEATITNLPWVMEETHLQETLRLKRVCLLNDLEAIANAVPVLETADLATLNEGTPIPGGALAVVAPGTGLGEAFLTWDGKRYSAHPTEGGHTDFGPTTEAELDLLRYLLQRLDHVSYEWVCSGIGLPNVYAFYRDSGHMPEPDWLREQLARAVDPTPVIVNNALVGDGAAEICVATLDMFVHILAAEAGNMALKVLATGGVYLAGGIPPRILPLLKRPSFLQDFQHKGRMSGLLADMPLHVVLNPNAALLGAARYGLENLMETEGGMPYESHERRG